MDFIKKIIEGSGNTIEYRKIKRKEYLTREGEIERHLYYVNSGSLRVIYLTAEEEHTIRFGYAGSIINALPSYFSGLPSEFYVQALRESEVWVIPKNTIYEYIDSEVSYQKQYRSLMEHLAIQQTERELDLLTYSPQARLNRVLKRSPRLFQEVPAKYIASYLRMTPETLSRLLKEVKS